jgi:hypothetical protein
MPADLISDEDAAQLLEPEPEPEPEPPSPVVVVKGATVPVAPAAADSPATHVSLVVCAVALSAVFWLWVCDRCGKDEYSELEKEREGVVP